MDARRMALRRTACGVLAAAMLCAPALPTRAQPVEPRVKAAIIYNIARFIEWPVSTTASPKITLCILGHDPFGPEIDALAGRPVGAATLQVRRLAGVAAARACQVVYISASESPRLGDDLSAVAGAHVLTLADSDGFAERGVVANLYLDESRVRFEINMDAARRSGLAISSQLLRLARITHDKASSP